MEKTLYSLGLVFYEIFSRGERPAELDQQRVEARPNEAEESSIDQGGKISSSDNDNCWSADNLRALKDASWKW